MVSARLALQSASSARGNPAPDIPTSSLRNAALLAALVALVLVVALGVVSAKLLIALAIIAAAWIGYSLSLAAPRGDARAASRARFNTGATTDANASGDDNAQPVASDATE